MKNILIILALGISFAAGAGGGGTTTGIGGGFRTTDPTAKKDLVKSIRLTPSQWAMLARATKPTLPIRGDLTVLGLVETKPSQVGLSQLQWLVSWPEMVGNVQPVVGRNPWNSMITIDEATQRGARQGDFVVAFPEQIAEAKRTNTRVRAFVLPAYDLTEVDSHALMQALVEMRSRYILSK